MKMLSRSLTVLFLAVFASFASGAEGRKNVVLFVVDDMSLNAGCYGDQVIKTPNIDRLASEGTRFTSAFCTTASCSASRSVILSGLHNHANGQFGHQHSYHHFGAFNSVKSLPVILGDNGYRTARIGKFHVAPEEVFKFQTLLPTAQGNRGSVKMAENCRSFVADTSKPFFLYFCVSDPHRSGEEIADDPAKPNAFGNAVKYEGVTDVTYDPKSIFVPAYLPDTPESRAEICQYYRAISRLDQGLGRLIAILKEAGQYENTLIIFTADNGMAFPGSKTTLYEPGMHLPLIVRSPEQKNRGGTCDAMISWVDFTPTILDYAGVKEVKGQLVMGDPEAGAGPARKRAATEGKYTFHGRSFLGLWDQTNPAGWDEVFASHTFHEITMYYPMRVLRTRQYKLMLNVAWQLPFPFASDLYDSATWQSTLKRSDSMFGQRRTADFVQRPKYELYDLNADPNEVNNLVNNPKYATVLADLQARLKEYQKRTSDPWLLKYTYE